MIESSIGSKTEKYTLPTAFFLTSVFIPAVSGVS